MNISDVKALFPGAQGPDLPGRVPERPHADHSPRSAMNHLESRVMGRADKAELHAQAERVRGQIATLLSAEPEEIAITKNASEGLNLFASSLDWIPGDNVVFCPELEHPNNVFLWYNLRKIRGVEVRAIPANAGHMPVAAMVAAMDGRTRLVTASTVTFSPGFISDIGTLAKEAQTRGVLTLLDAAQSAGSMEIDVGALSVDGVAFGTQESPAGILWIGFPLHSSGTGRGHDAHTCGQV